jgi:hypothetical protein
VDGDSQLNRVLLRRQTVIERVLALTTAGAIVECVKDCRAGGAYSPRHLDWQTCDVAPCIKSATIKQCVKHVVSSKEPRNRAVLPMLATSRPLNTNASAAVNDSSSTFDKRLPNKFKSINTFLLRVIATLVPLLNLLRRVANGAGQRSPQHLQTTGGSTVPKASTVTLPVSDVISLINTIHVATFTSMGFLTEKGLVVMTAKLY